MALVMVDAKLLSQTEIFDGKFDATHRYSQIEDVLASDRSAGIVVQPNDPVGIAGAIEQVNAAGVPVATTLFPIGPELNTANPDFKGEWEQKRAASAGARGDGGSRGTAGRLPVR